MSSKNSPQKVRKGEKEKKTRTMTNKFFLTSDLELEKPGEEEKLSVWEDNWDDDNLDNMDDFNEQLKQQMKMK